MALGVRVVTRTVHPKGQQITKAVYTVIPRKMMEKEEVDELEGVDQLARCSLVGSLRGGSHFWGRRRMQRGGGDCLKHPSH